MADNGISTLNTKQQRQVAKLNLAQTDRRALNDVNAPAYRARNAYDITQLPTRFIGNTIQDNPNAGGLITGRPWI